MVIADLFQLNKDYGEIIYIAGREGGNRQILDIDILELPDGMYWVKEGDFIITMGYFFTVSEVKFENFIRMLIRNKASGLGIKLGRFFDSIPENALKLAEKNNFPVINYPLHMSYKSMTKPVLNYLLGEENYTSYTLKLYKKELNSLVEEKYEIGVITEHLKRNINHDIFLMWENVSGFIYKTIENGSHEVKEILEQNRFGLAYSSNGKECKCGKEKFRFYRIGDKEQILAFLCVLEKDMRPLTDADVEMIRETIPYILIYLYSETRLGQYATRSKENFFMNIIDGNYANREQEMSGDAKTLGIIQKRPRCIAGVPITGMTTTEADRIYRKVGVYLDACQLPYTLFSNADTVYMITVLKDGADTAKTLDRYFNALARDLQESFRNNKIHLCISKVHLHLKDLAYAYEEFKYMAERQLSDKKSVYYYEDFMMDHLLLDIKNRTVVCHMCEDVIAKIDHYDRNNKSDMNNTLRMLAANDFNLTQTAEKMFLHRNTLYKRIEKIEKLLGFNLNNAETKLMLQLVMKLDEMNQKNN